MRKMLATVVTSVLITMGGAVSASASVTIPPRITCSYYTFNQVSTSGDATLRTIVGVCTNRPVCERRDLMLPNRIINVYNTCPVSVRR